MKRIIQKIKDWKKGLLKQFEVIIWEDNLSEEVSSLKIGKDWLGEGNILTVRRINDGAFFKKDIPINSINHMYANGFKITKFHSDCKHINVSFEYFGGTCTAFCEINDLIMKNGILQSVQFKN